MTWAIAAISVSEQIEKYGAYAGLASIVGLGVLSLLYFAQAREVKRLREWAGRAPEAAPAPSPPAPAPAVATAAGTAPAGAGSTAPAAASPPTEAAPAAA